MYPTVACVTGVVPDQITTIGPDSLDHRPEQPVPGCPGVFERTLRESLGGADAVLRYDSGACTPGRPHSGAVHHIWVIEGEATIAGRPVAAGGYAYVPAGVAHPIRNTGAGDCRLLQVHQRVR